MENDLVSDWKPAFINLSEEEKIIIKQNSSLFDKIENYREETNKDKDTIIAEFKEIEKETENELNNINKK